LEIAVDMKYRRPWSVIRATKFTNEAFIISRISSHTFFMTSVIRRNSTYVGSIFSNLAFNIGLFLGYFTFALLVVFMVDLVIRVRTLQNKTHKTLDILSIISYIYVVLLGIVTIILGCLSVVNIRPTLTINIFSAIYLVALFLINLVATIVDILFFQALKVADEETKKSSSAKSYLYGYCIMFRVARYLLYTIVCSS